MQQSVVLIILLLLAFMPSDPVQATVVKAGDYSSFWIWGGVKSQAVLSQAENLYILQGEISELNKAGKTETVFMAQGMPVGRIKKGSVWLVYRADTLRWSPEIMPAIILRLKQWQLAGNPVVGIQIDFDAKTRHLKEYASFLKQIRLQLPTDYRLGITGLLDWSSTGDIKVINNLHGILDEIVIQTYQGRKTITNYNDYLPALKRLTIPFKIGLIQNGEWQAPENLESNSCFKGYVVFLQNQLQI